ncbi:YIP1 family protein [Hyalangium minutum]|uniref:Putative lipoprotein n=1 Tax=Hyalangium minutum TaxID=394096 RepID=A0A085WGF1_9BACT|nr:YIP1 family protein [Hyalangium minutum]KFE66764.1 putative lipoprotein [Hyalangium minutum]
MSEWAGPSVPACALHPDRTAVAPCSRCGTFSCEECLQQTPVGQAPLCAACMERLSISQLPWDHREDLGWARAWFKSLGAVLLRPGVTFATAKPEGDLGGSLLFAFLAWLTALVPTFVVFALAGALIPSLIGDTGTKPEIRAILLSSFGVAILIVLLLALFGTFFTFIGAAIEHVTLLLLGKPRGFETTLRAASLSLAPFVLGLIPICGMYVAPIWAIIAKVFAFMGLHRTSAGIAVVGALAVPAFFLLIGCALSGVAWVVAMTAGATQ